MIKVEYVDVGMVRRLKTQSGFELSGVVEEDGSHSGTKGSQISEEPARRGDRIS